jgi:THO complex subunit 3
MKGHGDVVVQVCWDPTSPNRLATLSINRDKAIRLWDIRTGKPTVIKLAEE